MLDNAGDLGLGRSPGEENGNQIQYSFWRIPWTEERGGLQTMGLDKSREPGGLQTMGLDKSWEPGGLQTMGLDKSWEPGGLQTMGLDKSCR